ncbi:hypothetical protein HDV05_003124 [Chytridiales sp. JEL 0842]|nr:hypothetical protein HDV05_003124 [Chytridiales sp. JEL 0842]
MDTIGLGTYRLKGPNLREIIADAVEIGYRSFDTAQVYRNEEDVGAAIKAAIEKGLVRREDIFITTKVSPKNMGENKTRQSVIESNNKLGLHYIDLVLIHWPGAQGLKVDSELNRQRRREAWTDLEKLVSEHGAIAKQIGVSNYTVRHIEELLTYASVKPVLNQVEMHPLLFQYDLLNYCRDHNIILQAYSSFGEGVLLKDDDSTTSYILSTIATNNQATKAQILLSWALSHNIPVIPKASKYDRLKENFESKTVTTSQQARLRNAE